MNFKCLLKGHNYGEWKPAFRFTIYGDVPVMVRFCENCKSRNWIWDS